MKNATAKLVLAKIELTEGTDSLPTGAANTLQTSNFKAMPLKGSRIERNLDRAGFGSAPNLLGSKYAACDYEIEVTGSAAAGTPPPHAVCLRSAGFAETIVAATSVSYDPVSVGEESMTVYYNLDNVRQRLLGAKSTLKISGEAGGLLMFNYSTMGIFDIPTEVAQQVPSLAGYQAPVEINTSNTTFSLGGFAAILKSFEIDMGINTALLNLVGLNGINYKRTGITGRLEIILPDFAAKNYFTDAVNNTDVVFDLTHGTVAGNIVQIVMNQVRLGDLEWGNHEDKVTLVCPFEAHVTAAGDDDIQILFT